MSYRLRNGATVHARVVGKDNRQWVLAYAGNSECPWVTWEVDAERCAYLGHYFKSRREAADDLLARAIL